MKLAIEESGFLAQLIAEGFVRLFSAGDAHQFWVAYRSGIIGLNTVSGLNGSLSCAALGFIVARAERMGFEPIKVGLTLRTMATLNGERPVVGYKPGRHGYCTYRVLVSPN